MPYEISVFSGQSSWGWKLDISNKFQWLSLPGFLDHFYKECRFFHLYSSQMTPKVSISSTICLSACFTQLVTPALVWRHSECILSQLSKLPSPHLALSLLYLDYHCLSLLYQQSPSTRSSSAIFHTASLPMCSFQCFHFYWRFKVIIAHCGEY